jgi:hypothetical protein
VVEGVSGGKIPVARTTIGTRNANEEAGGTTATVRRPDIEIRTAVNKEGRGLVMIDVWKVFAMKAQGKNTDLYHPAGWPGTNPLPTEPRSHGKRRRTRKTRKKEGQ